MSTASLLHEISPAHVGAVIVLCILFAVGPSSARAEEAPPPPVARVVPHADSTLGHVRIDNYYWLRDRKNPEVVSYLESENNYTRAVMKSTEGLQQRLYDEMLSRIQETDLSVPERRGDWYYYTRTEKGKEYPYICRKKGSLEAPEELLLDESRLAGDSKYFHVGAAKVSPDQNLLAYTTDYKGNEIYTLVIKDLRTGRMLSDEVPGLSEPVEWAADNRTLFYVTQDDAQRPYRLYRHVLGDPASKDQLVFEEKDPLFNLEFSKSRSEGFLFLNLSSFRSTETRYIPADRPGQEPSVLAARRPDVEYSVEHSGDSFYIVTNDGATNFRVMKAPVADPSPGKWTEFVAERPGVLVGSMDAFHDFVVLYEREKAEQKIHVYDLRTGQSHYVSFSEPVYTYRPAANPDFNTSLLRFTYASFITPATVYDYDMAGRTREVKKVQEVPGGYDPGRYSSERAWARAADGTLVPVSLVYRKPLIRDGSRPMLLYGYGSYGLSTDASFNSNRFSLLDRGFIFAIAHIRGGQEMGRSWYDQGKLLNKKNTFTDFIDCAEQMVRDKYTSSDRLAIIGGSAGGMLMGAVTNMRPDLFKAVVADVPFVDVLNTMLDASIPLTTQEWEQWGDPREEPYYSYMRSYAPYENVEAKAYPSLLITGGLNDPRVPYWEPTKLTAKLRAMKTDKNLLLLKVNMGAGHGGASGRYDALRETALHYAFILKALGMSEGGSLAPATAAPKP